MGWMFTGLSEMIVRRNIEASSHMIEPSIHTGYHRNCVD